MRISIKLASCAISLLLSLAIVGCGGPKKVEKQAEGKWNASINRGLGGAPIDGPVTASVKSLGFTTFESNDKTGIIRDVETGNRQLFYYLGHSLTKDISDQTDLSQVLDPLAAKDWIAMSVDGQPLKAEDISTAKSIYLFAFMNCCWSANDPQKTAWRNLLHPVKDSNGGVVKTNFCYLGWVGEVPKAGAADFAPRFFAHAKKGVSVALAVTEAYADSFKEKPEIWTLRAGPIQYGTVEQPIPEGDVQMKINREE
jgi:hypothetical protein